MVTDSFRFFLGRARATARLSLIIIPALMTCSFLYDAICVSSCRDGQTSYFIAVLWHVFVVSLLVLIGARFEKDVPYPGPTIFRQMCMLFVPVAFFILVYSELQRTSWFHSHFLAIWLFEPVDGRYVLPIPFRAPWSISEEAYRGIIVPIAMEIQYLPYFTACWLAIASAGFWGMSLTKQVAAVWYFVRKNWRYCILLLIWIAVLRTGREQVEDAVTPFFRSIGFDDWSSTGQMILNVRIVVHSIIDGFFYALWISLFIGCIARREWIERLCHGRAMTE